MSKPSQGLTLLELNAEPESATGPAWLNTLVTGSDGSKSKAGSLLSTEADRSQPPIRSQPEGRSLLPVMDRKGVIFDMDGVLLDSAPYHFESWKRLAEKEGLPPVTNEWFQTTFGRTAREILPHLFQRDLAENEIRRLVDRKEALYREAVHGKVKPMPGLWRLIQRLHEHAWRLGVGSSGPRKNVELVIDQLNLRGLLDGYVSADDVEKGKPDPEVFLKTAEKMKVHPERCVVFEDATVGVRAAHGAGMKCVALTSTHPRAKLQEADRVIDSFSEVSPEDLDTLLNGH